MGIMYAGIHTVCYNYVPDNKLIWKKFHIEKNKETEKVLYSLNESFLVFVLKGSVEFRYSDNAELQTLEEGNMLLFPPNSSFIVNNYREETTIISCRFYANRIFCECTPISQLSPYVKEYDSIFNPLPVHDNIKHLLVAMDVFLSDNIHCIHFHQLKKKELFYLLNFYYSKEDLARFLFPIIGKDMSFKDLVLQNYHKAQNIKELAEMTGYGYPNFMKKFQQEFHTPPYQWLINNKSKRIMDEIKSRQKTFQEIADEYGFSSQSHFTIFCKRLFGYTPSQLRLQAINVNYSIENN